MRRTKIVATLGPATRTLERIEQLITAGLDVARLNFSHGTYAEHASLIATIRQASKYAGKPIAILQDLQGPKIRTGELHSGRPVKLSAGQTFVITNKPIIGDTRRVSTTYAMLNHDVHPGDRILLSDGLIELQVMSITDTDVETRVIHGGALREHQGINLPGVMVSAPAVTEKDIDDLLFGLEQGVDYVAISFVRQAGDVRQIKDQIASAGKTTPIIAKIERTEALEDLPNILMISDGIMVARGDLGVEMPPERVPIVQKQIIEAANRAGVPVITATQMLESMIRNPHPTRAEASDVANAIIDGTDAIMLSGETATGDYPVEAVQMMSTIAETIEQSGRHGDQGAKPRWSLPEVQSTPRAIAAAACTIASSLPVCAIVVFTNSGSSARLVSHYRPDAPILAFTPSEGVYRRLSLLWGVIPMRAALVERLDQLEQHVQATLISQGYAKPGDAVVITGGHPTYRHGPTNFLKVITVAETT